MKTRRYLIWFSSNCSINLSSFSFIVSPQKVERLFAWYQTCARPARISRKSLLFIHIFDQVRKLCDLSMTIIWRVTGNKSGYGNKLFGVSLNPRKFVNGSVNAKNLGHAYIFQRGVNKATEKTLYRFFTRVRALLCARLRVRLCSIISLYTSRETLCCFVDGAVKNLYAAYFFDVHRPVHRHVHKLRNVCECLRGQNHQRGIHRDKKMLHLHQGFDPRTG